MTEKIHPIPDVVPRWESDWSDYPDAVLIAMENGHVVRYFKDPELPHPAFQRAMDTLHRMVVGYQAPTQKKRRRL